MSSQKKIVLRFVPTILFLFFFCASSASTYAALTERFQTNQQGDFAMIGNNSSFDCHSGIPIPVVGTVVDIATCALGLGGREFWSVDVAANKATAALSLLSSQASSAAFLQLPPNAKISYARLYWSAEKSVLRLPILGSDFGVKFSFGTSSPITLKPDHFWRIPRHGLLEILFGKIVYQGTADVTAWVQNHGNGTYTVTGIPSIEVPLVSEPSAFSGWSLVVFYELPGVPTRHLALLDGFDHVSKGSSSSSAIQDFSLPSTGLNAKLGVIAFGGSAQNTGDSLAVNTHVFSDLLNPADNFF